MLNVPLSKKAPPRWHLIYYVLAAFNVAIVFASLLLNHAMLKQVASMADADAEWSSMIARHARLQQTAQALNAPGNDVFDSWDVQQQAARFTEAQQTFAEVMSQVRMEGVASRIFISHPGLLEDYDHIQRDMDALAASAARVFAALENGQTAEAARAMSDMDRKYALVTLALGEINKKVTQLNLSEILHYRDASHALHRFEYVLMGAMVVMVLSITAYGHFLAKKVREVDRAHQSVMNALCTSEAKFRALAEGVPVLVCAVDETGETTYANQRWNEVTGARTDEIIKKGWLELIFPEDRPRCESIIANAVLCQIPFEVDARLRRHSGDTAWFHICGTPNEAADAGQGFIISFDDMSDRKETEELLKTTLHEHRELLSVLDQACIISITDAAGRIVHVNEAFEKLSQFSRAELIGQNHRLINSGYHSRQFWQDMYRTVLSGGTWQAEVKNQARDGSEYWVHSTVRAFRGPDGGINRIISIRNDITPLRKALGDLSEARNRALAATQAKSEFLANMSHEIRTPMTAILGFTDLLLEEVATSLERDSVLDKLHIVRRNGEHLLGLINDILDLSKIEAGKLNMRLEDCSPAEILDDIIRTLKWRAAEKNLTIELECRDLPEVMHTDPTRLRQILLNLTGNALKFTERGAIACRVHPDPSDPSLIHFDVVDTGIGIPPEHTESLFSTFHQADTSQTRRFGGSGLGLVISRKLARALGGDVTLVNSEVGVGSHFRAVIPVGVDASKKEASAAPRTSSSRPPTESMPAHLSAPAVTSTEPNLSGLNVLLVDDALDNQRLVRFLLERAGASVQLAENGLVALQMVEQAADLPFHVIVMDVQMPVMDGIEAAGRLRETGYAGPMIALTANAMTDTRDKCLQAGFNDYLTKPINRLHLLEKIKQWSERRPEAIPLQV